MLTGGLPGATAALPTALSAVPLKAGLFEIAPKRGVRLDRGLEQAEMQGARLRTDSILMHSYKYTNIFHLLRRTESCLPLSLTLTRSHLRNTSIIPSTSTWTVLRRSSDGGGPMWLAVTCLE